jgi:hypothetical protein
MSYYYYLNDLFRQAIVFDSQPLGHRLLRQSCTCTIDAIFELSCITASVQKHLLAAVSILETRHSLSARIFSDFLRFLGEQTLSVPCCTFPSCTSMLAPCCPLNKRASTFHSMRSAGQPRRVDEVWLSSRKRVQEATSEPTARHKQRVLFHLLRAPVLQESLFTQQIATTHDQQTQGHLHPRARSSSRRNLQVSALTTGIPTSR